MWVGEIRAIRGGSSSIIGQEYDSKGADLQHPELRIDDLLLPRPVEDDLAVAHVGHDRVALAEVAAQQGQRQRVLHQLLDGPLQRPRAVDRVVARVGQQLRALRRSTAASILRPASSPRSRPSWISTIWPRCSRLSGWKITISSIRFRNSGRNVVRRRVQRVATNWHPRLRLHVSRIHASLPTLLVMITTVFLKSTVRPWPSVSRPSSSTCSRVLKTSGWAFSISSNSTTE